MLLQMRVNVELLRGWKLLSHCCWLYIQHAFTYNITLCLNPAYISSNEKKTLWLTFHMALRNHFTNCINSTSNKDFKCTHTLLWSPFNIQFSPGVEIWPFLKKKKRTETLFVPLPTVAKISQCAPTPTCNTTPSCGTWKVNLYAHNWKEAFAKQSTESNKMLLDD